MNTLDFLKKHKGNNFNCVYRLIDNGVVVYVGSTMMPYNRIKTHFNGDKVFDSVSYFAVSDGYGESLKNESLEIVMYNPKYNTSLPYNDTFTLRTGVSSAIESRVKSFINDLPVAFSRRSSAYVNTSDVDNMISSLEDHLTDFINKLHAKEIK